MLVFSCLLLIGLGFLGWYFERTRRRRDVRESIIERDVNNMCEHLSEDVGRLQTLLKEAQGLEPHVSAEAENLLHSEKQALDKMRGYLEAGLRKI